MKIDRIEYSRVHVDELQSFDGNPRKGDVAAIAESLRARGQYRPIVVNRGTMTGRDMEVLAGNHTLAAARSLGWEHIDVGVVDVDEQTAKAIVLADNRLADLGEYDSAALAALLSDLEDVQGTGYTDADIDAILAEQVLPEELTDRDEAPPVPEDAPITVPGDVWELGPHRVVCGDSTSVDCLASLMGEEVATCVMTDPPYGVNYVGGWKALPEGKRSSKDGGGMTIQNDGVDSLPELLEGAFSAGLTFCRPGAPFYVFSPQGKNFMLFAEALEVAQWDWRQTLIWVKTNHVLSRNDYHYRHEPAFTGVVNPGQAEPDTGLEVAGDDSGDEAKTHDHIMYGFVSKGKGRLGRGGPAWYGSNSEKSVFDFAIPNKSKLHPTMKPVDLLIAMLKNSCPPGGVILDLFGGSGSTLIAAHHLGAKARLVELDPKYVDVICRRWQAHTGVIPRRDGVEVNFLD